MDPIVIALLALAAALLLLGLVVLYRQWSAYRLDARRTRVLLAHERWEKEMNRERRRQIRRRSLGSRK